MKFFIMYFYRPSCYFNTLEYTISADSILPLCPIIKTKTSLQISDVWRISDL